MQYLSRVGRFQNGRLDEADFSTSKSIFRQFTDSKLLKIRSLITSYRTTFNQVDFNNIIRFFRELHSNCEITISLLRLLNSYIFISSCMCINSSVLTTFPIPKGSGSIFKYSSLFCRLLHHFHFPNKYKYRKAIVLHICDGSNNVFPPGNC